MATSDDVLTAWFGRFPHRNAALGRPSTPDEEAFLATWEGPPRIQAELLRRAD